MSFVFVFFPDDGPVTTIKQSLSDGNPYEITNGTTNDGKMLADSGSPLSLYKDEFTHSAFPVARFSSCDGDAEVNHHHLPSSVDHLIRLPPPLGTIFLYDFGCFYY
ncbi:hypothetical protein L1887_10434 [Cichorium endivia]|nr:hypothetical protein L1887_10434 [Cichorium endivia]